MDVYDRTNFKFLPIFGSKLNAFKQYIVCTSENTAINEIKISRSALYITKYLLFLELCV